jgi:peptidoglycan/xylan/chitin deacetylase (PgdA/CDA1 family)
MAARMKALAGWAIFQSRIHHLVLRNRAVIVVFHRVNNSYPDDPITCTEYEFEQYIRFFARFFEVVPLTELLERLAGGAKLGSTLTITFDDGYKGNATAAAPILERHGVRACFFVATNFIGTTCVPWWDQQAGIATQWMDWDDVRALRAAGHEIGSHTASHANLGLLTAEETRQEIIAGEARLKAELSESLRLFAYPYGARKNLAESNKPIPKALGLRCTLAAFGGTVSVGDDPFALKRTSITRWIRSPYQFGFELVIGASR